MLSLSFYKGYNKIMTINFVRKLQSLSPQALLLHFWAKLILGIGIGVVFAQYLEGYGWWIAGAGLAISMPGAWKALKKVKSQE